MAIVSCHIQQTESNTSIHLELLLWQSTKWKSNIHSPVCLFWTKSCSQWGACCHANHFHTHNGNKSSHAGKFLFVPISPNMSLGCDLGSLILAHQQPRHHTAALTLSDCNFEVSYFVTSLILTAATTTAEEPPLLPSVQLGKELKRGKSGTEVKLVEHPCTPRSAMLMYITLSVCCDVLVLQVMCSFFRAYSLKTATCYCTSKNKVNESREL